MRPGTAIVFDSDAYPPEATPEEVRATRLILTAAFLESLPEPLTAEHMLAYAEGFADAARDDLGEEFRVRAVTAAGELGRVVPVGTHGSRGAAERLAAAVGGVLERRLVGEWERVPDAG